MLFRRRKPEEGEITSDMELEQIYDYIRMLDAEGYPRAFMEFGAYRLEFDKACLSGDALAARVVSTAGQSKAEGTEQDKIV